MMNQRELGLFRVSSLFVSESLRDLSGAQGFPKDFLYFLYVFLF